MPGPVGKSTGAPAAGWPSECMPRNRGGGRRGWEGGGNSVTELRWHAGGASAGRTAGNCRRV
eukprot:5977199-Alexandrium_andersonii.AAC.1